MMAYRLPAPPAELSGKQVPPEDEMRLALARADEPALRRGLLFRAPLGALALAMLVTGDLRALYWIAVEATMFAYVLWILTRRSRLERALKRRGYDVPIA